MRGTRVAGKIVAWSLVAAAGLVLLTPTPGDARGSLPSRKVLDMSDRCRAQLPRTKKVQAIRRFGLEAVALRRGFVKRHKPTYKVEVPINRPILTGQH